MTSLRCFSIKGLRTWFAGADGLFCITPFYSTSRVLSVQGSMFDVQGSMFELGPPTHSLTHPPTCPLTNRKLGCGFAALCSFAAFESVFIRVHPWLRVVSASTPSPCPPAGRTRSRRVRGVLPSCPRFCWG